MNNKTKWVLGILVTAAAAALLLSPDQVVTLPNDGSSSQRKTFNDTYGQRYTEILLIGGNALTKEFEANVYNTWGLNGSEGSRDSSPATLLNSLNLDEVAKQHKALSAVKNGPRLWTIDWTEVDWGKELDFGGMKAGWVNWLNLKGVDTAPGASDYKSIRMTRNTKMGMNKGTRVSVLTDPEGNLWAMKSFSLISSPDQDFTSIASLGDRLKLPEGWKFRSVVLEQDLILTPDRFGAAYITQDNFGNTYERAGDEFSNFAP